MVAYSFVYIPLQMVANGLDDHLFEVIIAFTRIEFPMLFKVIGHEMVQYQLIHGVVVCLERCNVWVKPLAGVSCVLVGIDLVDKSIIED